jgi:hypothetical protein
MTTFTTNDREEAYKKILEEAPNQPGYEDAVPIAEQVNASPPHIVDNGASVMKDEPVAYINVEERKLEWAKPTTWHTPTISKMNNIPLYAHPAKTLTDEEIINIIERLIAKWTDEFKNYEYDSDESEENKLRDDVFAILRKAQEK